MNTKNQKAIKNVLIIGGGNIGTEFACTCAHKGFSTRLFTSKPNTFSNTIKIVGDTPELSYAADIEFATQDIKKAMCAVDLVFVTHPAFQLSYTSKLIEPYIRKGIIICVVPGTGGAEYSFQNCQKKGAILAGLQRVPGVARVLEPGKTVKVSGIRDHLFSATIPQSLSNSFASFISYLFDVPCTALPNYLSITLTPSNPILHTTRLYSMFKDYQIDKKYYDKNFLFYEEWTNDSSEILFKCDEELQEICKKLSNLDLSYVNSLKKHYDSDTPEKLTKKIQSIKSFSGLTSPMKKNEYGWVPDFSSRYFSADFPYGLSIIQDFARILNVNTPNIDTVINWYQIASGNKQNFDLSKFGINSIKDIYDLYS